MEKFNCKDCPEYQRCDSLCEKAENYADQDHVKHEELYVSAEVMDTMTDDNWTQNLAENIYLTRTEKKIVTMFGMGLTRSDVRQVLRMTSDSLRQHLHRIRSKMK